MQRVAKFKVMKENLENCKLGSTKMKDLKLFFSVPIIYIFNYNLTIGTLYNFINLYNIPNIHCFNTILLVSVLCLFNKWSITL